MMLSNPKSLKTVAQDYLGWLKIVTATTTTASCSLIAIAQTHMQACVLAQAMALDPPIYYKATAI